ncbi:MAG: hypothetical protein JO272_01055 [Pseudonocardiales bacterium]|nr:hypothetical protein [Pseudonocardiales bacterium]
MPRTAILYARSHRHDQLARQIRELQDWCDRAGVVPLETVAEVALGIRASKRCRQLLADVAAGRADLLLIRDVAAGSAAGAGGHWCGTVSGVVA